MKQKKLLALLSTFVVMSAAMGLAACGENKPVEPTGETINVSAEYGDEFDFTQYFKAGDSVANVKLVAPNGETASIENGIIYLSELGEFKCYLSSGDCIVINVTDTKGPLLSHSTQEHYYVGDPVTLSIYSVDARDGQLALSSISVKYGETDVALDGMTFTPEQAGTYTVTCKAVDSLNNETVYTFDINAEVYYAPAYGLHTISMNRASESEGSIGFTQEDVIMNDLRYNKSVANSDMGCGWAGITLSGGGLKALTAYDIVVEYETFNVTDPNSSFIVYGNRQSSEALIIAGIGEGSFTVRVTTDSNGNYSWSYINSVWITTGGSEILWTGITAVEKESYQSVDSYNFGGNNTLTIVDNGSSPDFFNTVVIDEGKEYFKTVILGGYGFARLTFSGANLKPETEYKVALKYGHQGITDPNFVFILMADDKATPTGYGWQSMDTLEFVVTTDANGEYSVSHQLMFINNGELYWYSMVEQANIPANYNVQVIVKGVDVTSTLDASITTRMGVVGTTVDIRADAEEMLASNPALADCYLNESESVLSGVVAEDGSLVLKVVYSEKVEEKGSVYGAGVVVTATGSNLTATTKLYNDGEKKGYTRTYATYSYCADGTLTVAVVDAKVGLKANTKYHVVLSIELDGAWPAIIGPGDCFILAGPAQDFIFEVTTDENGCFNSTWTNVSYNQGSYVDFVGVKFVEAKGSIYGDGVVVTGSAQSGGVTTQLYTDGEKAGYTRSYIVWGGGCNGTLTVAAGAAAGLKTNTKYYVVLSMEMDGGFPAVIGPGDCFIFAGPTCEYVFEVTTDVNGEFNQTWTNVYYNEGSYLDIIGVKIVEAKGSAYGTGVTVTGTGSALGVQTKLYKEGDKAGYTRTYFTYTFCAGGTFTVAADASAGLKANTKYSVAVAYEMDGPFPAIHTDDLSFSICGPSGELVFEITTDENGCFNQTWGGIAWNQGSYLDVVGVNFTEKTE